VNDHLKIISSVIFITAFSAIPAQADPIQPVPIQPITAPAQTAPVDDAPVHTGPVQTDTMQTDHAKNPAETHTYYNYAHDDAEYSVSLPGAPTVSTLWLESAETKPYLKAAPNDHAALGEIAIYKLVDIDTEESFDVKVIFLRASQPFLESLDKDKIQHMLKKKYSEVALSNETFNLSEGAGQLKWATLSGFTLDSHHHPAFYAIHYLTGLQSILVIEAKYSIENKSFQGYYNYMVNHIAYVQP
jgi:hypothetical protein